MNKDIQSVYDRLFEIAAEITADGEEHAQTAIIYSPSSTGYRMERVCALASHTKEGLARILAGLVRSAPEMYLVVHIAEFWRLVIDPGEEIPEDGTTKDRPGATEAVAFTFHREGEVYIAHCNINRSGPKPKLEKGELQKMKVGEVEGRFIPQHTR